jgi:small subunit ribosomal protein S20
MPNIKSAIKRVKSNETKRQENKMMISRLNTNVKKFKLAVAEKNLELAEDLFKQTTSFIDKAAKENTIHKNAASRKQAQIAKLLNSLKEAK